MRVRQEGTPLDPDVRMHRALADETRAQLLRILRNASEPLDAHALAEQLGLHLTTVRAHLDVLVDAELVASHSESRTTPGRPRRLYTATDDPSSNGTGGYRLLAEMLAGHVAGTSDDTAQVVTAGHAWGTYLVDRPPPYTTMTAGTARAAVVSLMDRLGFRPELDDDGAKILLRRCPFLDVAKRHPDVVCSLHLGLLRGALATLGAPVEAHDLEPFVQPSLCVAYTTTREQAG